ncbi:MAG: TVP38/TMEM64 family protein [Clostridia bacterium]|nr:TVP38/TMEM64 family protein [Clostridia bacterium]
MNQEKQPLSPTERRRKILGWVSVAVVAALLGLITWLVCDWLMAFSSQDFRTYIRGFGYGGWFVLLGLQFLQVFIALIPGELLETAAGYIYGPLQGTLLCYVGVALGSALIFLLVRRFRKRFAEVFVSADKLNEMRFLNSETKRRSLIFLIFFIPGTPKDLLTYFAGLTPIKISEFLTISLIARFPSVISSTAGGDLLGDGNYLGAIWLYGITAAVSLLGLWLYSILKKRKSKSTKTD